MPNDLNVYNGIGKLEFSILLMKVKKVKMTQEKHA